MTDLGTINAPRPAPPAAAEESGSPAGTLASVLVGFIPFIGSLQSLFELITGQDDLAGVPASRTLAAIGLLASIVPGGKGALKALSKGDEFVDVASALTKGLPALTRRQVGMINELRSGQNVIVRDIEEARKLLDNMPDLKAFTSQNYLVTKPAPPGTYRGDLINVFDPTTSFVHERGAHRFSGHYNLYFHTGERAAIIIRE